MLTWKPQHTPSYKQGFARNAAESANPNLWRGCVGLWLPALGPTGVTLRDVSGWGNHGTLTNMDPATDWVTTGQRGIPWALDFAGDDDYVNMGNVRAQLGPADFTLVTCHKWDAWGSYVNVVAARGKAGVGEWGLYQADATHGLFIVSNKQVQWAESSTDWMSLAVRRQADQISIWKDGVQQTLTTDNLSGQSEDLTTAAVLTLGARTEPLPSRFLDGQVGGVWMFTRALAASELQMVRRRAMIFPAAVVSGLTVTEETFQNFAPYDNDESIGTAGATGGTEPYSWEIISQTLL